MIILTFIINTIIIIIVIMIFMVSMISDFYRLVRYCCEPQDHELAHALDQSLISRCSPALQDKEQVHLKAWGRAQGFLEGIYKGSIG